MSPYYIAIIMLIQLAVAPGSVLCRQKHGQEVAEPPTYIFFDETPVVSLTGWRTAWGDSLAWADSAYDDSGWELAQGSGLWVSDGWAGKGIRWYRKAIFFPEALDTLSSLALYQVAAVSANEIYWDGRLVARNGTVAESREGEICGVSGQVFPVPRKQTFAGRHVIAVRQSNHHTFSGIIAPPLQLGTFNSLQTSLFRQGALSLFLAGIFVITALFHIAVLLGHANKWTYALFSAFCLSCAAYLIIHSWLRYFQVDLGLYYTIAAINDIPWFFMMSLLPVFFLFEFSAPRRLVLSLCIMAETLCIVLTPRLIMSGLLPVGWLEPFDWLNRVHSIISIVISIFICLWAIRRKRIGSLTVIIGLCIFLAGAYVSYRARLENGWAVGFAFLIIVITISLSRQMAARNREYQETQLRSARLELELLKRHIQPHFLLNSLNSIVAWLEEQPQTAARLVNALAEELRMLLAFSGKTTVSLAEEVQLCRAHLQVMSLRQDKQFSFEVTGGEGNERIPPLILHTLVENGLTHGYKGRNTGVFSLRCERDGATLRLELFNDSSIDTTAAQRIEGTGLRYVRTRLEEAYPGGWELRTGPSRGGWLVFIGIKKAVT